VGGKEGYEGVGRGGGELRTRATETGPPPSCLMQ
jgi:hypothetical protein